MIKKLIQFIKKLLEQPQKTDEEVPFIKSLDCKGFYMNKNGITFGKSDS
jgi:hypothetical protein